MIGEKIGEIALDIDESSIHPISAFEHTPEYKLWEDLKCETQIACGFTCAYRPNMPFGK